MSIAGRRAAAENAARRRMVENCPRHEPRCFRVYGDPKVFALYFYKCDTCGWAYGYDRRIAEREGLPLPPIEEEKDATPAG